MFYFMVGTIVILLLTVSVLLYKLNQIQNVLNVREHELAFVNDLKNEYLQNLNIEKDKNVNLTEENIQLHTRNQAIEQQNRNLTQFTDNIADKTKQHFFDMGKNLTSQLIDLQKKESISQRNEANAVVDKSVRNIMDRFDLVNKYVVGLQSQLKSSQENFNKITDNILNPVKIQNLTEITLENILNAAGIKKDCDFFLQPAIMKGQSILRPDAIVKLPNDKVLLIDAKSSSAKTEDLAKSMNNHIKQLSDKDYITAVVKHYNLSNSKNHITAMFVSSESILDQIVKQDKDFLMKAWRKNIFPVGPTGLMNLLVMSKYSIDSYERDKNQAAILDEVVKLLNNIFVLFEHTKKTSRSLNAFNTNFNKIVACMNSSVFNSIDRIRGLGLKHNKNLNDLDKIPVNITYQFDDNKSFME